MVEHTENRFLVHQIQKIKQLQERWLNKPCSWCDINTRDGCRERETSQTEMANYLSLTPKYLNEPWSPRVESSRALQRNIC